MRIRDAVTRRDIAAARALFEEYALSLGFDLCFQGFDEEVRSLPGEYAPPRGRLLILDDGRHPAGCVAVRAIDHAVCEMKRLYVRPEERRKGYGRLLAYAAIEWAREAGYHTMRLDTLASMTEALGLYRGLGFREIAPYRHNPIEGALYLEADLGEAAP